MNYAKAIIAIVVAAAGALVTALGTSPQQSLGALDTKTWLVAIIAILGSGGFTWLAENIQGVAGGIIKSVVAFLTAGVGSLVVALNDGVISQAEWITAFSAAAVALAAVYQIANRSTPAAVA
jgi:hypothetical protein